MAWYEEAVFYHIYPLGLTNAPKKNWYGNVEHRLNDILPWLDHIKQIGCNAIYIGPLFESVGHGYETTDYKKVDSRLGTNEDLKNFMSECHKAGIRVILDGVFNHVGRDFFAFQDLRQRRENSQYKDWFCKVNFGWNNSYNDGFSYENWGGHDLLVKLNQRNSQVMNYIADVIRFWVQEFDIDGIRLDAADVLDFDFMKMLRRVANEVKDEFWLMGEVIHGDYRRWANKDMLHSVTSYQLHKALYSAHNDHNYFEIAHTVKHICEMGLNLYNFVDNHDVERIYTKLTDKRHLLPVHILLYTLPGIPSIYYGSEFGIEGKKERYSDDSLRPHLQLSHYKNAVHTNTVTQIVTALGKIRHNESALSYGDYKELLLTTEQFIFSRSYKGKTIIVSVNNSAKDTYIKFDCPSAESYTGALTGQKIHPIVGTLEVTLKANSGEVWIPNGDYSTDTIIQEDFHKELAQPTKALQKEKIEAINNAYVESNVQTKQQAVQKTYEEMTIEELQQGILACMVKNGPVTDYMRKTVEENIWHDSLVTWIRSFN